VPLLWCTKTDLMSLLWSSCITWVESSGNIRQTQIEEPPRKWLLCIFKNPSGSWVGGVAQA
jgi:hypothetical protein